jgi:hypothetical protein
MKKKEEQNLAVFFHSGNTLAQNPFRYKKTRRLKVFLDIEKTSPRIKNKCLHISVNPSQAKNAIISSEEISLLHLDSIIKTTGFQY